MTAPSRWVCEWMAHIPADSVVIDLASGSGRHARLMASAGYSVIAVDRDRSALAALARKPGIQPVQADLESGGWPLRPKSADAIVVTNYLHRPGLGHLLGSLRPGGVLIYETFATGNERFGRPANPAFLLRPGELVDCLAGTFTVLAYEHGLVGKPARAVKQRVCAIRNGATGQRSPI